jgi:metallo-beta-lactamase family protein
MEIDGQRYEIGAQVHTIGGYSIQAGHKALVRFVLGIRKRPAEICILHGDPTVKQQFACVLLKCCSLSAAVVEIVSP